MADLGCCPGTSHCTENEKLKATTEKQRLRIDHQTVEIRVRVPASSPKPATAVFNEPARRALIVMLVLQKTGMLLLERIPCRAKRIAISCFWPLQSIRGRYAPLHQTCCSPSFVVIREKKGPDVHSYCWQDAERAAAANSNTAGIPSTQALRTDALLTKQPT